jgi:hypothetical protein
LRVALLVGAAHLALVVGLVAVRGDPAFLVHFGSEEPATGVYVDALGPDVLFAGPKGHDGQAFWTQARDPLLLQQPSPVERLDRPRYRAQRVAYPAMASFGRIFGEGGLLWSLALINVAAAAIGTWLCARLAVRLGAPSTCGLVFGLSPLVLFATALDLNDAVALAGLVGFALAARQGRWVVATLLAVLAVLSRETSLLAVLAVAVLGGPPPALARRRTAAVAVAATTGWFLYVRAMLGPDDTKLPEIVLVPFRGFVDATDQFWRPRGTWEDAAVAAMVVATAVWVVARWLRRRTFEMTLALPSALIVPFLGAPVVAVSFAIMKAIGPALTFAALDVYAERAQTARDAVRLPGASPA